MPQNRDHFRIVFPVSQRPCLSAGFAEWDVIDLSEHSAKVAIHSPTSLASRDSFPATIRFHDGAAATVSATVQRREDDHVILSFAQPLAYSLIMAEQRRLLKLYPRGALIGSAIATSQPIAAPLTAAP